VCSREKGGRRMVEDGYLVKIRIGRHVTHRGGEGVQNWHVHYSSQYKIHFL
jgi:hypothetical protein